MTTPATVIFAFFHTQIRSETYHSLSFFLYFITLVEFRQEFYRLIRCHRLIKNKSLERITVIARAANRYKTKSIPIAVITD
jgi:hypothetical protein